MLGNLILDYGTCTECGEVTDTLKVKYYSAGKHKHTKNYCIVCVPSEYAKQMQHALDILALRKMN